MSFASLVAPCLALRSVDTIETLSKTQQKYSSLATDDPDKANILHLCVNLQKKDHGLSGLMCEMHGNSLLNVNDLLTEEVFKGISVVKCNIDDLQAISILQSKEDLTTRIHTFMADMQAAHDNKAGMLLEQVIPSDESQDFWWWGQACEFKGGSATKDCISHDGKRGDVVFYDAFTCIARTDAETVAQEACSDRSYRDACVWEPILHGSIGIYSQRAGDGNNVFLVCVSDFDNIASDIVRSMKADLGSSVNVYDFCSSKEMWFLENIAQRNRLRLIMRVASHLGIQVPQKTDMYAHPKQTHSNLAVECCGLNFDYIECCMDVDSSTHNVVTKVRHYKDCVDVTQRKSPIPILLGKDQGILILLPEKANHSSFAKYHDTTGYVQNKTNSSVHLCPTLNISENSRLNLQKIRAEHQTVIHMTMDDLLYDMHVQGLFVPLYLQELLLSTDEQGCFLFYGVHHGANTPRLIYPQTTLPFVRAIHTIAPGNKQRSDLDKQTLTGSASAHTPTDTDSAVDDCARDIANPSEERELTSVNTIAPLKSAAQSRMYTPYVAAVNSRYQHSLAETMCGVFAYELPNTAAARDGDTALSELFDFHTHHGADDTARMSLEWNDVTVSLLQKITRMNQIDTLRLLPHVIFCNSNATV